jgi:peptidyl-prolyl cis-trans isomerase B (cyclophilin B)
MFVASFNWGVSKQMEEKMGLKIKGILLCAVSILILFILASCTIVQNSNIEEQPLAEQQEVDKKQDGEVESSASSESEYPTATIAVKDKGEMIVELYPDKAPNTVKNFVSLAESGYYDGLSLHRIVYGFMIQGGDPLGTGTGGPGYAIKGEFSANGFYQNDLSHKRGVISMARSQTMDSAGSQFFIIHQDNTGLDGQYAAFGQVVEGFDVLDVVAKVATENNEYGEQSVPINKQIIESITIQRNGWTGGEPEIIK